jgi:hypothetical protein
MDCPYLNDGYLRVHCPGYVLYLLLLVPSLSHPQILSHQIIESISLEIPLLMEVHRLKDPAALESESM